MDSIIAERGLQSAKVDGIKIFLFSNRSLDAAESKRVKIRTPAGTDVSVGGNLTNQRVSLPANFAFDIKPGKILA